MAPPVEVRCRSLPVEPASDEDAPTSAMGLQRQAALTGNLLRSIEWRRSRERSNPDHRNRALGISVPSDRADVESTQRGRGALIPVLKRWSAH